MKNVNSYDRPLFFLMLDAAVAVEAIDGAATREPEMIHSEWASYTNRLYASEWFELFGTNDFRHTLSWRGRFSNFGDAQVYNFYSSGEEVLREWYGDPPTNALSAAAQVVEDSIVGQSPPKSFVWVWQEKAKGRAVSDGLLGSTHGGWRFNTNYTGLTPAQAAALSDAQLRTNAFFDFGSPSFSADLALQGALGNAYAYTYRDRIRSDAIPALTWAAGSHLVPRLSPVGQPTRNFNMHSSAFQSGWPSSRMQTQEGDNWWHSDFKDVAYVYTFQLFDKFVELGDLK